MMYQKILENIILPLGDVFNNSSYTKQLKYWRQVDTFSEQELQSLQEKNLKKILQFAVKEISIYKEISLNGNTPYDWILNFPILTKDTLRSNGEALLTKDKNTLITYSSSGSTGIQTTVFMDKEEQSNIRAILTHWWEWSGYQIGNNIVQTGMDANRSKLKRTKDFLYKTYYIPAFSLTETQLKEVCDKLQNPTKSYYLVGYASSLHVIATYALKKNYKIQLSAVISLGDKLFSTYKNSIQKAFKCNVFDTYGCNEGFLIASQKDLEYKYIMSPHVYLEILDDDNKPVKDGVMGHVVVTRLDGFSMPLIRYKIGDLAIKLPKNKYPEKRNFNYPLLQQIVGRESDVVHLLDGKKLIVHSFTGIFEYISEIKQFQVLQEHSDAITIYYIKSDTFTLDILQKITNELQQYIQDINFKIFYKEVHFIAPSKSGKPEIIINKIKNL